ncbi:MAG: hypothetical protein VB916_01490 [Alphaproteobacteria bacterium]|jgi:hypothetical protein
MLNRRFFSKSLILSLSFFSMGHAPWGQWQVYRMRHMLILSVIEDKNSYPFSKKIIHSLEKTLPESRARPARARGFRRVYSLLSTDQMPLVVLSKDIAISLLYGTGVFSEFSPVNMNLVYDFGSMVLLARPKMPDSHTWRITDAIIRSGEYDGVINNTEIPIHNGSKTRFMNLPMPEEPRKDEEIENEPIL